MKVKKNSKYLSFIIIMLFYTLTACSKLKTIETEIAEVTLKPTLKPTLEPTVEPTVGLNQSDGGIQNVNLGIGKAEYFMKDLCKGIHSIFIDNNNNMYIGNLGDTDNLLHKKGLKKIYKITPDKKVETISEIECQYITSIYVNENEDIYTAVLDNSIARIVKINKEGVQEVIAEGLSECTIMYIDLDDNLYLNLSGQILMISKEKEQTVFLADAGGIIDEDFRNIYSWEYMGNKITRYLINENNIPETPEVYLETIGVKGIVTQNDKLYVLSFNRDNKIISIDTKDKSISETKIDMTGIEKYFSFSDKKHWLTSMTFGKGDFMEECLYITTWSGDIIRVQILER